MCGIIKSYIGGCLVAFLLALTVVPVDERWPTVEVGLLHVFFYLFIIGGICVFVCKFRVEVTPTDIAACLLIVFYVLSTWLFPKYPCRTDFLKTIETFLLYSALRILFSKINVSERVLLVCLLLAGCYEALLGAFQLFKGYSRNPFFSITGSFFNPGPYSAYLMIAVVIGVVVLQGGRLKQIYITKYLLAFNGSRGFVCKITLWHLFLGGTIIMAVLLLSTWSRSAFVSIGVICLWFFRGCYRRYKYIIYGAVGVLCFLLYFLKQGSADGRMIIWQAALSTWKDAPWLGVGVGGFLHATAAGMAELYEQHYDFSSADVTHYSYNVMLEILVEQGVIGLLIACLLCTSAFLSLNERSRPLFYGMASLFIFSLFSYPFDLLPYRIIAVLVIAWSESTKNKYTFILGCVKSYFVTVFFAFVSFQTFRLTYDVYKADCWYQTFAGMHGEIYISDYQELLYRECDNPSFLFDFGKCLRVSGRYNDSNAILMRGALCSADPMFFVLIGNNFMDMEQFLLAEEYYFKAFVTMPNRLYPLYKLMLFYKETGEKQKAKDVAKYIIGFEPKIESTITNEIKRRANKELMLKKHNE